ncbi:hypothetical protein [Streptomyces xanthophaeus]|uniref:hypothetical protein n=1 Tax=Streptomyces xanthophaeus TaxID=67385 RepID=UPI00386A1A36
MGWFTEQGPSKLILLAGTGGRRDLLVVPPPDGTRHRVPSAGGRGSCGRAGGRGRGVAAVPAGFPSAGLTRRAPMVRTDQFW